MTKSIVLSILAASCLMVSCKKNPDAPAKGDSKKAGLKTMSSPVFTYYRYGTDIVEGDFLDNADDADDQRFNYINHAMTLGLLEIYRNHPTLLDALLTEVEGTAAKSRDLFKFATDHPSVNAIFDAIFAQRFNDFSNYNSWKDYVEENYVYDMAYIPHVAILNVDNYDIELAPYISEPLEINETKFTQFDDDYPLWMYINSVDYFSTVNDWTAENIGNPILAVRNETFGGENLVDPFVPAPFTGYDHFHLPIYDPPVTPMSCGLNPLPSGHTHEDFNHVAMKITDAYENNSMVEYRVAWAKTLAYRPSIPDWTNYLNLNGDPVRKEHGWDFPKSQLGITLHVGFTIFGPDEYNPTYCWDIPLMNGIMDFRHFVVGAYEYDWGHSKKPLGQVKADPGFKTLYGKRKFHKEWYGFDPGVDGSSNNYHDFDSRYPNTNTQYVNTTKGELTFERKDH